MNELSTMDLLELKVRYQFREVEFNKCECITTGAIMNEMNVQLQKENERIMGKLIMANNRIAQLQMDLIRLYQKM